MHVWKRDQQHLADDTGLQVHVALDTHAYPTGVKATYAQTAALSRPHDTCYGDGNYALHLRRYRMPKFDYDL